VCAVAMLVAVGCEDDAAACATAESSPSERATPVATEEASTVSWNVQRRF
jgi:hypothetical protein